MSLLLLIIGVLVMVHCLKQWPRVKRQSTEDDEPEEAQFPMRSQKEQEMVLLEIACDEMLTEKEIETGPDASFGTIRRFNDLVRGCDIPASKGLF